MSGGVVYSIDTSSILEARNRSYPPDVFPGLWQKIEDLIESGRLVATEEVRREIDKVDDDARTWSRAQKKLYVPLDTAQVIEVRNILSVFSTLVNPFTGNSAADPFVIALAKMNKHVLVTQEKRTNSTKKTKIPNVCDYYGVKYITVLELIRQEKWTFS